ncbi:MAG: D-aminoacyl-tRNA deacylase, partial [Acidimicrobiales bacterium]
MSRCGWTRSSTAAPISQEPSTPLLAELAGRVPAGRAQRAERCEGAAQRGCAATRSCSQPARHVYAPPVRALLQRVSEASVSVEGHVVGSIGWGLCALVGVSRDDSDATADRMAERIWRLRIFADEAG